MARGVLSLKSPNRYEMLDSRGRNGCGLFTPQIIACYSIHDGSALHLIKTITYIAHSLEGAMSPIGGGSMHSARSKRASPGQPDELEVKTAGGAFRRVELQWKDVNYTVREGKKGEVVRKVSWVSCVVVRIALIYGHAYPWTCVLLPCFARLQVLTNQWGKASSGEILAIMGPSGRQQTKESAEKDALSLGPHEALTGSSSAKRTQGRARRAC